MTANITFNPTGKHFVIAYDYNYTTSNRTADAGIVKTKSVSLKPRTLTSMANQIVKAYSRGLGEVGAAITSQDISGEAAVVTISGAINSYTVSLVPTMETFTRESVVEVMREVMRWSKEHPDKNIRKQLRKKQFSLAFATG
jgi:hypothetical protein